MPEQALYLKWRPLRFDDVVGQEHVTRTLRNSLKSGRIRHAYLFSGPRGTGKTTTARLLAKAVNCQHEDPQQHPCNTCATCVAVNEGRFLDLIEIDAASHTGVDDVRDLRDKIAFAPGEGRYKVYIIDEVHRFSGNAFDALLKTLEEPPDHALFILATTEIDKVPATIKSRCLPFEFRRLSLREVTERLALIANQEGIQIDAASLELIAREGTGSVRDSISLLDQIVADPAESITLDLTQRILGTASSRAVRDLIAAILAKDSKQGIRIINDAVDSGSDPRQFGQQIVEHLRYIMLAQTASADLLEVSSDDRDIIANHAQQIERSRLLKTIRAFNEAVNNYRGGWQPQLTLELALIDSLEEPQQTVQTVYVQQTQQPAAQASAARSRQSPQQSDDDTGEPQVKPGEPPVIPVSNVQQQWGRVRSMIHHYKPNTALPDLLQHVSILAVEGNVVSLGVSNQVYLEKLTHRSSVKLVQWALENIHKEQLRVKFVMVGEQQSNRQTTPPPDSVNETLYNEVLNLGGEITEEDNNDPE